VEPLTPDIAKQLGLEAGATGVIVADVDPTGTAAEAGIQRGDLIPEVNRQPVRSPAEIRAELQKSGSKPVLLLVARDGKTYSLQRNLRASISHRFGLRRTFNQADIDETVEHELNSYCSKQQSHHSRQNPNSRFPQISPHPIGGGESPVGQYSRDSDGY